MAQPASGRQTATVLVIDPDPVNQRTMRNRLMFMGYSARTADDYESALAVLEATPPDVILLVSPIEEGEKWDELHEQLTQWSIPYIQLGEADTKIGDGELNSRISGALRSRQAHEALAMENARLSAERLYDPVTGLFNRRYIMIRVEEEIRRSSRHAYPLSCLILDIDGFAEINEKYGLPIGDTVLRDMAHIVTRTLRATDIVARYREDEFIAVLTDTGATGAQIAANRLRDAVASHDFGGQLPGGAAELTTSIGIAYWHPSGGPGEGTWEPQLIGLAERALRAAKQSGRNRVVMLQAS
jgi:two-component system cell cycle response regulator